MAKRHRSSSYRSAVRRRWLAATATTAAVIKSAEIITAPSEAAHQRTLPVEYRRRYTQAVVEELVFPSDPDSDQAKRIERCVMVRVDEAPVLDRGNVMSAALFSMPYVDPADPLLRLRMNWDSIRRAARLGEPKVIKALDWTGYDRNHTSATKIHL